MPYPVGVGSLWVVFFNQEIIITKRGKPVAKLVPYAEKSAPLLGYLAGSVTIVGDIVAPINMAWDADTDG